MDPIIIIESEYNQLLSRYTDPYHRARLLAVAAPGYTHSQLVLVAFTWKIVPFE